MKKLMIAAAAAAMIGSAFGAAQVYEYKLTLKTTTCKEGKVAANTYWISELGYEKGDEVIYRTQSSLTLKGLTWGCHCDTALAGEWNSRVITINKKGDVLTVWDGITFWNEKTDSFLGGVYNGSEFSWDDGFINLMGKKADEVEACWAIVPSDDALIDAWELNLAGFGKVKHVYNKDEDNWCDSYITSASGSVVGYLSPDDGIWTCTYCDQYGTNCDVFDFCGCLADCNPEKTVAYGSFTMKYNSSASKKLEKNLLITKSYGFKKNSAVLNELQIAGE